MKGPTLIFLAMFNIHLACGINVAGMLDFSEPKPKIIERVYVAQREKAATDKNRNDNSGERKIGVICASGGCNTTSSAEVEGSDTISADVVVAVKTSLNANEKASSNTKDKSDSTDENADVPVVVGYGGVSDLPRSHVIPPDNKFNPHPILVSDIEQRFPELGTPHVRGGNNGFLPSLGVSIEFKPQGTGNGKYPNNYHKYQVGPAQQGPWNKHHTGYQAPELTFFGKPVPWYRRDYDPYRTTPRPIETWTKCVCHPNSVWTSQTTPSYINLNHPGKQINDKLAPLL